jgi:hypothetical protein
MKKIFVISITVLVILFSYIKTVSAEGGKVRGEISEGPSFQFGECPFNG